MRVLIAVMAIGLLAVSAQAQDMGELPTLFLLPPRRLRILRELVRCPSEP
jgi:hypothetical protein